MYCTAPNCHKKLTGKQTKFCSQKCKMSHPDHKNNDYAAQVRRAIKRKIALIKLFGGKCKCGYSKNLSALDFHHLNPKIKSFGIDARQCSNRKWEVLVKEAKKCELLCHNCHMEEHHPELSDLL